MTDWLPPGHTLSGSTDSSPPESGRGRRPVDSRLLDTDRLEVWHAFGRAVLGFHYRVELTAMCRCGRTIIECDVMAQARAYGLMPELPGQSGAR